jgi:uncharacterized protein YajQ (UPF0234 family)
MITQTSELTDALEAGDRIEVTYTSNQSGNRKTLTGTVESVAGSTTGGYDFGEVNLTTDEGDQRRINAQPVDDFKVEARVNDLDTGKHHTRKINATATDVGVEVVA